MSMFLNALKCCSSHELDPTSVSLLFPTTYALCYLYIIHIFWHFFLVEKSVYYLRRVRLSVPVNVFVSFPVE